MKTILYPSALFVLGYIGLIATLVYVITGGNTVDIEIVRSKYYVTIGMAIVGLAALLGGMRLIARTKEPRKNIGVGLIAASVIFWFILLPGIVSAVRLATS